MRVNHGTWVEVGVWEITTGEIYDGLYRGREGWALEEEELPW